MPMDLELNSAVMEHIARIHLTWKRWLQRGLVESGLNLKQISLLHRLSTVAFLNPSEVAEFLFSDRPTTTTLLATLERRGLLSRHRDPDNRKRVRVIITAAGRKALRDLPPIPSRGGDAGHDPLKPLSLADRQRLLDQLRLVSATLERQLSAGPGDDDAPSP